MPRTGFVSLAVAAGVLVALCGPGARASADVSVGAGATLALGGGQLDTGCGAIEVLGSLDVASGTVAGAGDVSILSGGVVDGGQGVFTVAGSWSNAGTFSAGTGSVLFVDGCGSSADILGTSSFADLTLESSTGKTWRFESGLTQTVTGTLTVLGELGNLLVLRATTPSVEAFLSAGPSQDIDFVDVADLHATGSPIIVGNGSVDSGNTDGWTFGLPSVPALPGVGFGILALLILGTAPLRRAPRRAE